MDAARAVRAAAAPLLLLSTLLGLEPGYTEAETDQTGAMGHIAVHNKPTGGTDDHTRRR